MKLFQTLNKQYHDLRLWVRLVRAHNYQVLGNQSLRRWKGVQEDGLLANGFAEYKFYEALERCHAPLFF